jgi:hypothetical protein
MRAQLIKISLVLFGLEHALLESVSEAEKNIFLKLTSLFLMLASICMVSSVFLFFLISSSFWFAMLFGPLLAIIFLSIIRFSILTIQRSLYEVKIPEVPIENINSLNAQSKMKGFFQKLSFPGIESIMRILINGMMACLIIFPLVTLLHFQQLESLNQQKRDHVFNEFISSKTNHFTVENNHFNEKIKQVEKNMFPIASLESQAGAYLVKQRELNKLKTEQTQYKDGFVTNLEMETRLLIRNLSNQYFIIYTFSKAIFYPDFIFVAIAILGLIFYLHYLQHSLKTNETYQYTRLAREKYVSIVLNDYNQTKMQIEKTLKKKFPDYRIDLVAVSRWANPPFNTIEKNTFPARTSILKSEFIKSINSK